VRQGLRSVFLPLKPGKAIISLGFDVESRLRSSLEGSWVILGFWVSD
jgi:hypothetical protein